MLEIIAKRGEESPMLWKYPPSAPIRGASASIRGSSHAITAGVGSRDRHKEAGCKLGPQDD